MPKRFLGVDAGTSSVKVCVFSADGELLRKAERPVVVSTPAPGFAEIDPEAYWRNTVDAIREAVHGMGTIAGIGVDSACPTTVVLDGDLAPLRPGIIYMDHRTVPLIAERAGGGARDSVARFGNRPNSSTCWLANLAWLREHEPEVYADTRHVVLLAGFLVARMTGRLTLDWSQASYSGGFNTAVPESGWNAEALARWDAREDMLPELGPSCRLAGTVSAEAAGVMGMEPGAAVAFGSGDTGAAAFAIGIREAGDVFESAGTSGVVTFCLDKPDFHGEFMNRCGVQPGRWLAHGAMSTLGGAFAWLLDKVWPDLAGVAELEALAKRSSPGANGLVFLPYLAGERSPIWDADACGCWLGLRLDSDRADMARAVFEGAAFGLRQLLELGGECWGYAPEAIVSVGGGSRSRFWSRVKADIMGVRYLLADNPDAAAWGSAVMGAVASGEFSGPDDPRIRFIAATPAEYGQPEADGGAYDRAYAVYRGLYPALRSAMGELRGKRRGGIE